MRAMRTGRRSRGLLWLAALAAGVSAQTQPLPTGLILGQVVDAGTGQPIAGAIVYGRAAVRSC